MKIKKILSVYSSQLCFAASLLLFVTLFLGFLPAAVQPKIYQGPASFFDFAFGTDLLDPNGFLIAAFVIQIISVIISWISYCFSKLGKKCIRKAGLFSCISIILDIIVSVVYFCFLPIVNSKTILVAPLLMASLILISGMMLIPSITLALEKKAEK